MKNRNYKSVLETIKVSSSVCAKMCRRKDLHSGETRIGFPITIMHQLIMCFPSRNLWQNSQISVLLQLSYSPDVASTNLFPKLKVSLKGKQFDLIEDIQANSETDLYPLPLNEKIFRDASRSGNTVGAGVFSLKEGTTLKEIHFNSWYELPFWNYKSSF